MKKAEKALLRILADLTEMAHSKYDVAKNTLAFYRAVRSEILQGFPLLQ